VFYDYDPSSSRGLVYLRGKGSPFYYVNMGTIGRGEVEGNWFVAEKSWEDFIRPIIAKALGQAIKVLRPCLGCARNRVMDINRTKPLRYPCGFRSHEAARCSYLRRFGDRALENFVFVYQIVRPPPACSPSLRTIVRSAGVTRAIKVKFREEDA